MKDTQIFKYMPIACFFLEFSQIYGVYKIYEVWEVRGSSQKLIKGSFFDFPHSENGNLFQHFPK